MEISNSNRLVYPDDGITKSDVAKYYQKIYPYMIDKIRNRSTTVRRFNENIKELPFFQRNVTKEFPDNMSIPGSSHINVLDRESLNFLVNKSAFEFYVGMNVAGNIYPDRIVIDLDPPKESFTYVREAALEVKELLNKLGLKVFVMTTGSNGLHLLLPLNNNSSYTYIQARNFIKKVGSYLEKSKPDKYTTNSRKVTRDTKVLIDYSRIGLNQVTIAPYSLKGKRGAPIATPIDWKELDDKSFNSKSINIKNIFSKVHINPWRGFKLVNNNMEKAEKNLNELMDKSYAFLSNTPILQYPSIITKSADNNGTPFDSRFKPAYTPIEMLKMGIFGGAYFSNPEHIKNTPKVIFQLDKRLWGNPVPDPNINYYKVLAGSSLEFWEERNLMHKDDPAGWFHWYVKYYYGRRHEDDFRQIKRWRSFVARHAAQAYGKTGRERQKQALLQWAWNNDLDYRAILETYKG